MCVVLKARTFIAQAHNVHQRRGLQPGAPTSTRLCVDVTQGRTGKAWGVVFVNASWVCEGVATIQGLKRDTRYTFYRYELHS